MLLTEQELAATETALANAMTCAMEKGWSIEQNVTYDPASMACCAIGALIVCNEPPELAATLTRIEDDYNTYTYPNNTIKKYISDSINDSMSSQLPNLINTDPLTKDIKYPDSFIDGFVTGFDGPKFELDDTFNITSEYMQGYMLGQRLARTFIED